MSFLPINLSEAKERGFETLDFVIITGDAYVDHPSFGTATYKIIVKTMPIPVSNIIRERQAFLTFSIRSAPIKLLTNTEPPVETPERKTINKVITLPADKAALNASCECPLSTIALTVLIRKLNIYSKNIGIASLIKFKLPKEVVTVKSSDKFFEDFFKVGFICKPS